VTKGLILGVCPAAVASAAIPRSLATWLHQSRVTGHTELGINGIEQLRRHDWSSRSALRSGRFTGIAAKIVRAAPYDRKITCLCKVHVIAWNTAQRIHIYRMGSFSGAVSRSFTTRKPESSSSTDCRLDTAYTRSVSFPTSRHKNTANGLPYITSP
jgi:hypothetical protein